MDDEVKLLVAKVLKLSPDEISNDTSPENTPQWDSVETMNIVCEIEECFHITITNAEIPSITDFGGMCQLLRSKGVKC